MLIHTLLFSLIIAPAMIVQASGQGKGQAFVQPKIPVPPADRIPTPTERTNLAKGMVSSSSILNAGMVPLLPHAVKKAMDGKTLVISVITSEEEYLDCTRKAPPVKIPPNVSTSNDPAWDGGLYRPDWTKEVLLVVVLMERANCVTLSTQQDCWIAPDEKGVGHLLLIYAGKEYENGMLGPVQYPYVMLKVARQNLKQVAVIVWRAGDKPNGVVTIPEKKE